MPRDTAMKVLGLHPGYSADDLKRAVRDAAMQHHPDRGGSTDAMAQVNLAHEALADTGIGSKSDQKEYEYSRERYARQDELAKVYAKIALDATIARFDETAFVKHFETIFGEPFGAEVKLGKPEDASSSRTFISFNVAFANQTRTKVFYINASTYFTDLMNKPAIGNPEIGLNLTIMTDTLVDRRKIKLTQSNYQMSTDAKILSDPERLFPTKKLKTQIVKSVDRKLSKRDIILTFEHELRATLSYTGSDVWVYIPVGPFTIALVRITMMKAGMWMINGIYEKHRRVAMGPTTTIYEEMKSIDFLVDGMKHIQQTYKSDGSAPLEQLTSDLRAFSEAYKTFRTTIPKSESN